jgi:hypothetical protein
MKEDNGRQVAPPMEYLHLAKPSKWCNINNTAKEEISTIQTKIINFLLLGIKWEVDRGLKAPIMVVK